MKDVRVKRKLLKTSVLLTACLSVAGLVLATFSTVTLAKYITTKKTQQAAWGLGGERMTSIFFNANVWTQGKDSSGKIVDAAFYMYVWNATIGSSSAETLIPSAHINPVINNVAMDLYVFEFDTTKKDHFLFLRWNPEVPVSTDIAHGEGKGNWNQTDDLEYDEDYNYYCIDSWGTSASAEEPAQATPNTNKIVKNLSTGILTWAY